MEHLLFETKIYTYDCNLDTEILYNKIKKFQSLVDTVYKSNSGGYQGHDFEDNDLKNSIWKNIPQRSDKPFVNFTIQAWVNVNGYGHWNDVHDHCDDGVLLSGILYVKCPQNSGGIRFYDTRSNCSRTYQKYYEKGKGNYIRLSPYENLMIFFPPSLMHMVEPNQSNHERVSIAFNIVNPVFQ